MHAHAEAPTSKERRTCLPASFALHGKFAYHQVADRVTGVGSVAVGFVEVRQRVPVWVDSPANLFEIFDQMFAPRIDEQAMLAGLVAQHGVYAINAILDGWISLGHILAGVVAITIAAEEVP